jgi:hypothetical protein
VGRLRSCFTLVTLLLHYCELTPLSLLLLLLLLLMH